jgi:hypothetical protein
VNAPDRSAAEPVEGRTLHRYPEKMVVARLAPGADVPEWAESASILSITATAAETSIVCAGRSVPRKVPRHGPYTAFAVAGTLEPTLVGVLAALLQPLAEAGIPVMTISTYDTDWVLVPIDRADDAAEAWRRRGNEDVVAPVAP